MYIFLNILHPQIHHFLRIHKKPEKSTTESFMLMKAYFSKNVDQRVFGNETCILLDCVFSLFNTFQNMWKIFITSYYLAVCLRILALFLVSFLGFPREWYMLLRFIISCSLMKMKYAGVKLCLKWHKKNSDTTVYEKNGLRCILIVLWYNTYNESDMHHWGILQYAFYTVWSK